ncbi:MAG: NB-ARC domain-containing protein [Anaerolineae bacterium]|nr:NB-ARC domain-containing protein [Anaerolineae bacterium]
MDLKKFGEQLKTLRRQAQLSQQEFVDALDQLAQAGPAEDHRVIDGPLVSRWEHGSTYKGRHWKPTRSYMRYLIRLFAGQLDLLTAQQWTAQAGYQFSRAELQDIFSGQAAVVDWGETPGLGSFYGREREQESLERWLVADRCRLVAIVGIGGIGKTLLATKVARQVSSHFDTVIWRSLINAPPLTSMLRGWFHVLSQQQLNRWPDHLAEQLELLFDTLRRQRCLLILDNVETIMQQGSRAGQYRPGYEVYGQLIQRFGDGEHQSCLLLTSRERPQGLARLANDNSLIRFHQLAGLAESAGLAILQRQGLSGPAHVLEGLVEHYSGHPLALKLIAQTIQELFAGDSEAFLREEAVIFDDIRDILDQQFARLSALERDIMLWLAIEREAVSPQILRDNLVKSEAGGIFLEALRSLQRRSLLEQQAAGLTLQNVVLEFLTDYLVENVCREIEGSPGRGAGEQRSKGDEFSPLLPRSLAPLHLNRYALIKAQAKEYVRASQSRLILKPVAERLLAALGQAGLEARLKAILEALRQAGPQQPGYAAGNLLNLLLHLKIELRGYDFSGLTIRQAYLGGLHAPDLNFAGAHLAGAVFTDTFGPTFSVAFSPDGKVLAAGTAEGQVRLWRVTDGQPLLTCEGHLGAVWSVAFSPDGRLLVSGSTDGTVRLWDVNTGQSLKMLAGHTHQVWSVAFSPDGRLLASGSTDGTVRLWEVSTGHSLKMLAGHTHQVRSVAFSPDGRLLASGSFDHTVGLWEVSTGHSLKTLAGHTHPVRSVAFSPDGRLLASGSNDQTVRLWEVPTGQNLKTLSDHTNQISSVAFSPDGRLLASGSEDQTVRLWEVNTGQSLKTLAGHTHWVSSVAFSPDGRLLASSSNDQTVRLWEVPTGQNLKALSGYTNWVWSVAFSPDGRFLAGGCFDHTVGLWNVNTGQSLKTLSGHTDWVSSVAFSPDGRLLASGCFDHTAGLWDLRNTGQNLEMLAGHTNPVWSVAFSPDGRLLASGSNDKTVGLWDLRHTGHSLKTLSGHTHPVRSVAFSPDGRLLASGSQDQTVRLWEVATGQSLKTLAGHTHPVSSVVFSPDGRLLASGSEDQTVRLWEAATGQGLKTLAGHTHPVSSVAFSPDGRLLASGGLDQTVRLWEVPTGQSLKTLSGHTNWVWSVAFSPDGRLLASGSADATLKLWDVRTGDSLKTLQPQRPYERMNITSATGLTKAQKAALRALGAIETPAY